MERKHQVFISSTFTDLKEERKEIIQALLEMDCIPAGMEMFPAANEDQLTLIKGVIDECDYYLIVIGGRYGSLSDEGISYTEEEYDYAVSKGIPVMGFVPATPDLIPQGKTDKSDVAAAKLEAFKSKVQSRMTKEYKNPEDLGSKVVRSLGQLRKSHPRPGWVRGDQAMTPEVKAQIAELRASVAEYQKTQAQELVTGKSEINRHFAYGTKELTVDLTHSGWLSYESATEQGDLIYTWDEIVEVLGPFMIEEAPEYELRKTFNKHMLVTISEEANNWLQFTSLQKAEITDQSWGTIIVQLRALEIITTGTKKRTVSDRSTYWKLTPAGDDYLITLRAIPDAE